MINVGVDLGFLDNRLNVTFDYFFNRTKDILLQLPTPTTYGGGDPNQNAGIVSTKGWELNVNYRFNTGEVHHKLAANVSDSRNKVVSLRGEEKSVTLTSCAKALRYGHTMHTKQTACSRMKRKSSKAPLLHLM